ncbi:DUF3549 family protein [Gallaecimonas sp. GXIMD4217]|uniref:DUF3549 family protein n=1 Tax=Gallaecimonas sp. GXIMD4217 TaxID=3131927 RepID=UPI00311AF091
MSISNLAEFLAASGAQYRVFDMGRRVTCLPQQDFEAIAAGTQPYPMPLKRHAWLGIVFWQTQPFIWFVHLPVDEQGLLEQGASAQFMALVMAAMQSDSNELPDNPFTFKPTMEKLASFHSQIRLLLGEPASLHYEQAQSYFRGQLPWQDWSQLGVQGIADVAVRDRHQDWFRDNLAQLPAPVLEALCQQLEHLSLPQELVEALYQLFLSKGKLCLARALAGSDRAEQVVDQLLTRGDLQALVAIAGRLWKPLQDPARLQPFLEQAAELAEGDGFRALFADLVMLPDLRVFILALLRQPQSPALAQALDRLAAK